MPNRLGLGLLGGLVFAAAMAPGISQAAFCKNYKQTSSNAGACPTCKLSIASKPSKQQYVITSNNGWSATVTWIEGDDSVAEGPGKWKSGLGHAYSGKSFEIFLTQQGNKLDMVMETKGVSGRIEGSFRCGT